MGMQPWPDYGGKVVSIHSSDEWKRLLESSPMVIIDCYATWCPPCKAAAPVYARMSEEYQGCVFAKMNVDEVPDLSQSLQVKAMPTFKLFRGLSELDMVQGFNEQRIRDLLVEHGCD